MIGDLIEIAKALLNLIEAAMRDDPAIETTDTEAAIKRMRSRLDDYAEARRELETKP